MEDIRTRSDLEKLLYNFYEVATEDEMIGHHFDDLDWEAHLPVFVDFWEKTLFDKPGYFGNPLSVHQEVHAKSKLTEEQFQRWLKIFRETVDRLFEGSNAENAKSKAAVIAKSLNQRLNKDQSPYTSIKKK